MNKSVIYNGRRHSKEPCDKPTALKKGEKYEVVNMHPRYSQVNYVLKGIAGSFCSSWFDDIKSTAKKDYIAMSNYEPTVGLRADCYRLVPKRGIFRGIFRSIKLQKISTSPVIKKEEILSTPFSSLYKIETKNSIYYMLVK